MKLALPWHQYGLVYNSRIFFRDAPYDAVAVWSFKDWRIIERSNARMSWVLNVISFNPTIDGVPEIHRKSFTQWMNACSDLSRLVPIWNRPGCAVLLAQSEAMEITSFSVRDNKLFMNPSDWSRRFSRLTLFLKPIQWSICRIVWISVISSSSMSISPKNRFGNDGWWYFSCYC